MPRYNSDEIREDGTMKIIAHVGGITVGFEKMSGKYHIGITANDGTWSSRDVTEDELRRLTLELARAFLLPRLPNLPFK